MHANVDAVPEITHVPACAIPVTIPISPVSPRLGARSRTVVSVVTVLSLRIGVGDARDEQCKRGEHGGAFHS